MTPKQILQRAQAAVLSDKDGEKAELLVAPGLPVHELLALENARGRGFPPEIRELIEYCRAITLRSRWTSRKFRPEGLCIELYGRGWTGYPAWANPGSTNDGLRGLELSSDICGNPWVIDVDSQGDWGRVFYVSHDPPLIVYQSPDLSSFLAELFLLYAGDHRSYFIVPDVDRVQQVPLVKVASLRTSEDSQLREFALTLKDGDLVADLRKKNPKTGFNWGAFGGEEIVRHPSELLFGLVDRGRKGFLSRFIGR